MSIFLMAQTVCASDGSPSSVEREISPADLLQNVVLRLDEIQEILYKSNGRLVGALSTQDHTFIVDSLHCACEVLYDQDTTYQIEEWSKKHAFDLEALEVKVAQYIKDVATLE